MEAIRCDQCGSSQVQALTEEKYFCSACENVFLVHNLSKEFQQTDTHISDVHQDLKNEIRNIVKNNGSDEEALLAAAEQHLKMGNWDSAAGMYEKVTENFPSHAAGWYGRYRALTGDFNAMQRYALFACNGIYIDEEDRELADGDNFFGNGFIGRALSCADADKAEITKNVAAFIRKCAEYGKQDIENSMSNTISELEVMCQKAKSTLEKERSSQKMFRVFEAAKLVIWLVVLFKFVISGTWVSRLIFAAVIVLMIVLFVKGIGLGFYICPHLLDAFGSLPGLDKDSIINQVISKLNDQYGEELMFNVLAGSAYLDNYNVLLNSLNDEDKFIQQYINGSLEGMKDYAEVNDDYGQFTFDFLSGRLERFNYLLPETIMGLGSDIPQSAGIKGTWATQVEAFKKGYNERKAEINNQPQEGNVCSMCGALKASGDAFCSNCGARV